MMAIVALFILAIIVMMLAQYQILEERRKEAASQDEKAKARMFSEQYVIMLRLLGRGKALRKSSKIARYQSIARYVHSIDGTAMTPAKPAIDP